MFRFITFFVFSSLLISCTPKEKLADEEMGQEQEEPAQDASAAATKTAASSEASAKKAGKAKECPNGKPVKVIEGNCGGKWSVKQNNGTSSCVFSWGPIIKCPEGTQPLTYNAVCYGETVKPITKDQSIASSSECAEQFGEFPLKSDYKLQCCPN